jgi:hypothetical protein
MAPHAYDVMFWRSDYADVASLADEGTSFAIWLTDDERGEHRPVGGRRSGGHLG